MIARIELDTEQLGHARGAPAIARSQVDQPRTNAGELGRDHPHRTHQRGKARIHGVVARDAGGAGGHDHKVDI